MATKKPGAARKTARKSTAKRAPAKKSTAKKSTAKKSTAKRATAKKSSAQEARYTDPALRERLKKKIVAGTKGGRAGQWSARKAQLLAHAYEEAGGGYRGGKSATQRHLDSWTSKRWTTRDGKKAQRGKKTTARYLPEKAWKEMTPAERKATDDKKREGSRSGRQHVANTGTARKTRAAATKAAPAKKRAAAKRPAAKRPAAKRPAAKRPAAKR